MADHPFDMRADDVNALIDGFKTQTRWPLKEPYGWFESVGNGKWRPLWVNIAPGDRLWVREAWCRVSDNPMSDVASLASGDGIAYRAADDDEMSIPPRWRSPVVMPRSASRITLTVTEVLAHDLRDITESDIQQEGVRLFISESGPDRFTREVFWHLGWKFRAPTAREAFADIWNSRHGSGDWEANSKVCALTFTVQRRNIDAVHHG